MCRINLFQIYVNYKEVKLYAIFYLMITQQCDHQCDHAYNNAFTVLNYFDIITETDNRFF